MEEHWTEALITKAFEQKKRVDSSINQEQNEDFYDASIILSSTDNYFTQLFWEKKIWGKTKEILKAFYQEINYATLRIWHQNNNLKMIKQKTKYDTNFLIYLWTEMTRTRGSFHNNNAGCEVTTEWEKQRLTLDSISLSLHSRNNMSPRLTEIGKRRGWKRKSKRKKENWLLLFHLTEKQLQ